MGEIYKDILGYEGLYKISNTGKVKSLPKSDGNGHRTRLLKQEIISRDHTNYRRVTLSLNGETSRFSVHRLVADAFLEKSYKPIVNHKDNNGENNLYTNLEWVTHEENMMHAQNQWRLFEAQSKGGIAGGRVAHDKMMTKINDIIGTKIGQWTVLSHSGKMHKKQNDHMLCVCSCGTERNVGLTELLNGSSTRCRSCSMRKHPKKDKFIKIISQIDNDCNTIATFSSAMDAERHTRIDNGHISSVILGRRKKAGGYYWSREKLKI